jgi:hypothetical protein
LFSGQKWDEHLGLREFGYRLHDPRGDMVDKTRCHGFHIENKKSEMRYTWGKSRRRGVTMAENELD